MTELFAGSTNYCELNEHIKALAEKPGDIAVRGVFGQRYIGCGLKNHTHLHIFGTLGNDSACYMDGATLEVGNAQDGIANTMNDGKLIVHGTARHHGLRHARRRIFIKGYAGYRAAYT